VQWQVPSAAARGPYWTGAFIPWAWPFVSAPRSGHSRAIIWCSVTSAFTSGTSVACRRCIPAWRAAAGGLVAPGAAGRLVLDQAIRMISQWPCPATPSAGPAARHRQDLGPAS
jgi:hypothetical protein